MNCALSCLKVLLLCTIHYLSLNPLLLLFLFWSSRIKCTTEIQVEHAGESARDAGHVLKENAEEKLEHAKARAEELAKRAETSATDALERAKLSANETMENVKESAESAVEHAKESAADLQEKASAMVDHAFEGIV